MKQATDFREESTAVAELLDQLSDDDYERPTAFKGWTINEILRHLHVWNHAAFLQLTDEAALISLLKDVGAAAVAGGVRDFERKASDELSGGRLRKAWIEKAEAVAEAFAEADPAQRLIWGGPTMSARSSISARFMETWAHAQAIYDELGLEREANDRIENIVVLGLNTYEFCFKNRGLEAPAPRPQLSLEAPSGAAWTFGDSDDGEHVRGKAAEFCQVVTQCRNVADTALSVEGPNAVSWMSIAQCFAGPPNDPPAPGIRRTRLSQAR